MRDLRNRRPVNSSDARSSMTDKIERKPHVESITVKHLPEEYPDLSDLGTFANAPKGKFVIDRSKLGHLDPREYRFFNADNVSNMKEAMENYQRALSYGVSWSMFGIQAFADVLVPLGDSARPNDWMVQTIHSGGLWGIESDSEQSYF